MCISDSSIVKVEEMHPLQCEDIHLHSLPLSMCITMNTISLYLYLHSADNSYQHVLGFGYEPVWKLT